MSRIRQCVGQALGVQCKRLGSPPSRLHEPEQAAPCDTVQVAWQQEFGIFLQWISRSLTLGECPAGSLPSL